MLTLRSIVCYHLFRLGYFLISQYIAYSLHNLNYGGCIKRPVCLFNIWISESEEVSLVGLMSNWLFVFRTWFFSDDTLVCNVPSKLRACARARHFKLARTAFSLCRRIWRVFIIISKWYFAICPSYLAYNLERPRFPLISVTLVLRS